MQTTMDRIETLETELKDSETKLGETETKLGETETKLGETETKLGETETKLTDTQRKLAEAERALADAPSEKEISIDLGGGVNLEMVLIPAGEFLMGSPESDTDTASDEKPQHRVRLTKPFYLGVTEVTQAQYEQVMGSNPSHFKGSTRPVEQVSWEDAVEFCRKLSAKEGVEYRLPTEAEWEYACRAGSTTKWCFGDRDAELGEYAWFTGNSGRKIYPVSQKKPNPWGLHDMHGNVWEWCADWFDSGYYATSPVDDPQGPSSGTSRVLRGGSFVSQPGLVRSALRGRGQPVNRSTINGFRVARTYN